MVSGLHCLKDGRMLAVNRQDLAAMLFDGGCEQFACDDQGLFVGDSKSFPLFCGG
jgi:hypothetical protein